MTASDERGRGGYDAVLVIAFGGPTRPEEIRPFLAHVLRGRPVPPSRLEEVAHHYEVIGGRSPLVAHTEAQRRALAVKLAEHGIALPVRMGMRHSKPFLADVLSELAATGVRRVLGVIMAAFHDRATVERYAAAVSDALRERGLPLSVDYVPGPEQHPGFVAANAERVRAAYAALPEHERSSAALVFTAHSVPTQVGEASGYVGLYEQTAARVAQALGVASYQLAYQSRSGAPQDPWLDPDISDVLGTLAARGERACVVAPIGFVCDHVEVLYDLDVAAAEVARALPLRLSRARTVGDHPAYIEALADGVRARL